MRKTLRNLSRRGVCMLLLLVLLTAQAPLAGAAGTKTFSDVTTDNWFYSFVTDLASQGVVSGYPDGTYRPQNNLTVGEALSMVLMASGVQVQAATDSHWASGFADYAVRNGYMSSALREDLNAEMKRLDVAQLAAKALKLVPPKEGTTPFSDLDDGYVTALFQKGIIAGTLEGENRYFYPNASITRAEICAIVWNMRNTDVHKGQIETEYYYVDVLDGVPVNGYDPNAFQLNENGRMDYTGSGVETMHGIDISSFQGEIDWDKVKADGIDFVIIRVGGRGYTLGQIYDDTRFEKNMEGALKAGLKVGAYFFSQAITVDEAREEAQYVLEKLTLYSEKITMPVVFDWEDLGNSAYRGYRLDSDVLGACANLFCSMMEEAGYQPMIYFNRFGGYRSYDLRQVLDYQFWFAQYTSTTSHPTFYYDFDMWQYSDKGTVDGIEGKIDMNLYLIKD